MAIGNRQSGFAFPSAGKCVDVDSAPLWLPISWASCLLGDLVSKTGPIANPSCIIASSSSERPSISIAAAMPRGQRPRNTTHPAQTCRGRLLSPPPAAGALRGCAPRRAFRRALCPGANRRQRGATGLRLRSTYAAFPRSSAVLRNEATPVPFRELACLSTTTAAQPGSREPLVSRARATVSSEPDDALTPTPDAPSEALKRVRTSAQTRSYRRM